MKTYNDFDLTKPLSSVEAAIVASNLDNIESYRRAPSIYSTPAGHKSLRVLSFIGFSIPVIYIIAGLIVLYL